MKIMTILGTRPEVIRLSRIIKKLDGLCRHTLVHTGQNYDVNLNDIFFDQLNIRRPDHYLDIRGATFGEQVGKIIAGCDAVIRKEKPDRLLVLGDTNSGLAAIVAKRMGIPVYHLEAGNRCYDDRVPEEINRRIIDHCSDVLMPYTERSRANLLREGIEGYRVLVTGNPILEVINHYGPMIEKSDVLKRLALKPRKYFLVTMHREENVDIEERLRSLVKGLIILQKEYGIPIICSVHPRTRNMLHRYGITIKSDKIRLLDPFGLFDFIKLERNALCVLSDSGTVQEECCIFGVANVTIRDVTERPETLECGSNILSSYDPHMIKQCVSIVLQQKEKWVVPHEYLLTNVSDTVVRILLGYHRRGH